MSESVEEYLKSRLLIDENQNINTKFDELVSIVKMLALQKCGEQKKNCLDKWFDFDDNKCVHETITEAKWPLL